jgi:hypothetical protein
MPDLSPSSAYLHVYSSEVFKPLILILERSLSQWRGEMKFTQLYETNFL